MIERILPYRLASRLNSKLHDRVCRPVLGTAPIKAQDDGVVIFSMIGTKVLLPYLVAVKSFWHQSRCGKVILLDDGSLTDVDRRILAHHCDNPEIITMSSVDRGEFPKGGCWERLLSILDRRRENYCVQLDSDTVTLGPVDDVTAAISANRSFTLLGGEEWNIGAKSCVAFSRDHYPHGAMDSHIQTRMEAALDNLPRADKLRYIRGCAGFTGFARDTGADPRSQAAFFRNEMERLLGDEAMKIWGSEQVTSSFLIANDTDPLLLPYSRYHNFWGENWQDDMRFVHFVGSHRYTGDAYAAATRRALALMDRT